jgi:hypothetical protein
MLDNQTILAVIEEEAGRHGTTSRIAMFGGIAVLLGGNMVAALSGHGLLLRVGKERHAEALSHSGTRPMEVRGKSMEGYVYVDPAGLDAPALAQWSAMAVGHVAALPAKADRQARGPRRLEQG